MTRTRLARGTREALLTLGAMLGFVCILATVASAAFGVKPLVFRSGSMSPAISTGDLAVAREVDASSLERGDIVSVVNAKGTRVTHRLVESTVQADVTQLVLKGDANETADADIYTATRADKILFHVPEGGLRRQRRVESGGVFILGLYVAWMVALIVRRPGGGRSDKGGTPDGRSPQAELVALIGPRGLGLLRVRRRLSWSAAMLTVASPALLHRGPMLSS